MFFKTFYGLLKLGFSNIHSFPKYEIFEGDPLEILNYLREVSTEKKSKIQKGPSSLARCCMLR